ncbi:hypothetical protein [Lactiplantibacillus plantarum]|nr:hypothetical protein [Lactiplantibacillus plantarum]
MKLKNTLCQQHAALKMSWQLLTEDIEAPIPPENSSSEINTQRLR